MSARTAAFVTLVLGCLLATGSAHARITRIEIEKVESPTFEIGRAHV